MGIRRFSLSDWGHIAEILGAMAVIISRHINEVVLEAGTVEGS